MTQCLLDSPSPPPSPASSIFLSSSIVPPMEVFQVNVGGSRFALSAQMLAPFPDTRLGRMVFCPEEALDLCDDFRENEFFFDRNSQTFQYILNFYRTGHLHVHEELCELCFLQELQYWGLDELKIQSCCRERYYRRKDQRDLSEDMNQDLNQDLQNNEEEDFEGVVFSEFRRRLWDILEKPDSSRTAQTYGTFSMTFVVLSVVNMVLMSLDLGETELGQAVGVSSLLDVVEYVCVAWFSLELLVRFLCVRDKCRFSLGIQNLIDLLAVLPFYVTSAVELLHGGSSELENMGRVVQVLRLLRSLRMLKLGRHLTGLKSLGLTIAQCYEEVGLLLLFLGVGISLFSTVLFSLERDVPGSTFDSVPAAWWWATTSMTTVGYGDIRPDTALGKILAFICILSGILILALPIAIINERFSVCYLSLKVKEAALRHGEMMKRLARGSVGGSEAGLNLRDVYASNVLELMRLRGRERASTRSSANDGALWW
ncbi:potassium voltage-gated channel subfamily V member 1 [Periophthalmus magnuspinnatus]|uniref:potassium voltage-gated channel subfamily V member 1 n=1 Tax=Periophthalmus magnuspinnatus TaxID=409849 RepID=UPI0024365154|nr:potassium voltage-gated channel subfamily V member 1 [Periophthalmus magnuspinnatus]